MAATAGCQAALAEYCAKMCPLAGEHVLIALYDYSIKGVAGGKAWRCYAGDASRLLDLVRGSITCRTVRGITDCLARIQADPSVFVLNVKNRFDPGYDGNTTAGYRNLALLLVIADAETVRLGVHDHVCELQLGLSQINELKTTSGHRNYRKWRDMRAV